MPEALWLLVAFACFVVGTAAGATELRPGDAAPSFSLVGSDGRTHALADYAGKRTVVLAWFPKAFTGG